MVCIRVRMVCMRVCMMCGRSMRMRVRASWSMRIVVGR